MDETASREAARDAAQEVEYPGRATERLVLALVEHAARQAAEMERARLEGVLLAVRTAQHLVNDQLAAAVGSTDLLREDARLPEALRPLAQTAFEGARAAGETLRQLGSVRRLVEVEAGKPYGPTLDLTASTGQLVLVVDDEPALRQLMRATLSPMYGVLEADDGVTAWAPLQRYRPDAVVLDIRLPGRSGLDLLLDLRADPTLAATPVVLCTAATQAEDQAAGRRAGADVYLTKPFSPRELLWAVERAIAARTPALSR